MAAAISITVLSSSRAREAWPSGRRRVALGLVAFVGLIGLGVSAGPVGALLVLGVAAIVGLLVAGVRVLPRWIVPPLPADVLDSLGDRDRLELTEGRLKLENDLRTTALQAFAGLAVLAGAVLAFQQLMDDRQQSTATRELTLQGQASERFSRAIDQLGNDRLEVQLGGIYGLEQVARLTPENRQAMTEALVAYLHRRSPRAANNPAPPPAQDLRVRAPDVQAALTVLIRRAPPPTETPPDILPRGWGFTTDPPLDLTNLDLSRADISGETILTGRDQRWGSGRAGSLQQADLRGTDLRGATIKFMILTDADLRGADLSGADLRLVELPFGGPPFGGPSLPLHTPSHIDTVKFSGAVADRSTQWPAGFNFVAAGVKMT